MLRALLACTVLSFCLAAPAAASGDDVVGGAASPKACDTDARRVAESEATPVGPLLPESVPTNWCERPDDPRCSPASPAPATLASPANLPTAIPPHAPPKVAPPLLAASTRPSTLLLGPSAGVRNRIERPPA